MNPIFALIVPLSGNLPVDPGFGVPGFGGRPDQGLPGYGHPDQGLPGHGHPGNALPIAPVRPSPPIVLPPGMWPPSLPPGTNLPDNSLPAPLPGHPAHPIVIPPDPSIGISLPIYLPQLPPGSALLIALPQAQPKDDDPLNAKPAILVQSGKKPVLVYVSTGASPKSSYE
jgi:hypothetical protein